MNGLGRVGMGLMVNRRVYSEGPVSVWLCMVLGTLTQEERWQRGYFESENKCLSVYVYPQ